MNKQQFLEKTADYFSGALEMVDDDMPDGAWLQMHVDIAESQISDCCECLELERPTGIDGHDIAMYYLINKSDNES